MQWRAISRLEGSGLDRLRRQVVSVAELMPHTEQEYRWFKILSVTAGICEELVFRGFMIWYLAHWMPMWLAALVGGVVFGLAHWYQGTAGVIKTGITGIIMGALYVATGSLLWPAIVHAAIDIQGGAAGRKVLLSSPEYAVRSEG
jgi:membrane protease YdiL (CAAX protease family)